jgi:hypothetical protein
LGPPSWLVAQPPTGFDSLIMWISTFRHHPPAHPNGLLPSISPILTYYTPSVEYVRPVTLDLVYCCRQFRLAKHVNSLTIISYSLEILRLFFIFSSQKYSLPSPLSSPRLILLFHKSYTCLCSLIFVGRLEGESAYSHQATRQGCPSFLLAGGGKGRQELLRDG